MNRDWNRRQADSRRSNSGRNQRQWGQRTAGYNLSNATQPLNNSLYGARRDQRMPNISNNVSSTNSLKRYEKKKSINQGREIQTRKSRMTKKQLKQQYKKYLSDTINVFYEDRPEALILNIIDFIKPLSIWIGLFLALSVFFLSFVRKMQGSCPPNADCGVFIHCNYGYELIDGRCQISEATRNEAEAFCIATIYNLQLEYGRRMCDPNTQTPYAPYIRIYQLIQEFKIASRATVIQIYAWFQNPANMKQYKFVYSGGDLEVIPTQKRFTAWCQILKIYYHKDFTFYFVLTVLIITLITLFVINFLNNIKAAQIYEYLSKQMEKSNHLIVDRKQIESKLNIKVNQAIWDKVDNLRVQKEKIAYYEDQQLHWIRLKSQ